MCRRETGSWSLTRMRWYQCLSILWIFIGALVLGGVEYFITFTGVWRLMNWYEIQKYYSIQDIYTQYLDFNRLTLWSELLHINEGCSRKPNLRKDDKKYFWMIISLFYLHIFHISKSLFVSASAFSMLKVLFTATPPPSYAQLPY